MVERLHLDQELVHHPAGARGHEPAHRALHAVRRRGADSVTRLRDRIDLLDEADRAPFLARRLAESLEERSDPVRGHPEPHRLERGRRDEQEGDARLLGHRLRQVRLPGPRRTFEEDAAPGRATELVPEGPVPEEHVERAEHLVDLRIEPLQIGQPDLDLFRVHRDVRRTTREEWHRDHQPDRDDEEHRRQVDLPREALRDGGESKRPARRVPPPEVGVQRRHDDDRADEALPLRAIALAEHVGAARAERGRA